MHFNFVLTNHGAAALQALDDILRPLFFGLRAADHQVTVPSRRFCNPPIVNIVVEDFSDPAFVQVVHGARAAADGFLLGVLCPLAAGAPDMTPARREALRSMLPAVDFAWTLAPSALPPDLLSPERVAVLSYGFHENLVGPRLIAGAARRDVDVVVYGSSGARLDAVVARLAAVQRSHFPVRAGTFPDYIVTDLLSRAKIVAIVGRSAGPDATCGPRALKAICNGALVVAEEGSVPAPLSALVESSSDDDIPQQCARIISEGRFVERGLKALEQLRGMAGMREGVGAAAALAAARSART